MPVPQRKPFAGRRRPEARRWGQRCGADVSAAAAGSVERLGTRQRSANNGQRHRTAPGSRTGGCSADLKPVASSPHRWLQAPECAGPASPYWPTSPAVRSASNSGCSLRQRRRRRTAIQTRADRGARPQAGSVPVP